MKTAKKAFSNLDPAARKEAMLNQMYSWRPNEDPRKRGVEVVTLDEIRRKKQNAASTRAAAEA